MDRSGRGDWYFRDKVLLPGEGHGWSSHSHAVITLVLAGRLNEDLGSEVQSCGAFELHYKPQGLPHATSTGPNGVRMLLVGFSETARDGERAMGQPRVVPGGARAARAFTELLSIASMVQQRSGDPRCAIRRLQEESLGRSTAGEVVKRPSWITEVRARIQAEEAQRNRLARLASEFGVHPVYLARTFRSCYGLTIGSLRRRLRTDRAVMRLLTGDVSLARLALELGYSDESHFAREFKRETGWTPGGFRSTAGSFGRVERRR
ncbi:MAG TPA: AraC family transcriptional regulator [Thermoanaerobaculia bacterium]|nr:AraC family transcriptional regulator [Thermoanaerobaculia bacterium]